MELTDNLNIKRFTPLITPAQLKEALPQTDAQSEVVARARKRVAEVLCDRRRGRLVITGPCSLHDEPATLDYAQRLRRLQQRVGDGLVLIMRAYFEKPRTTLGWKGMLYDPHLDGSYDIEYGFRRSRDLLRKITDIGLPTATEFLDPIVPQYLADMVTWAAIGARTTESQVHRQMASGLSMPIGFKNSTEGHLGPAVDAIKAARSGHAFMGINRDGCVVIAETRGNPYGHLVMRGGTSGPNYASEYVAFARVLLAKAHVPTGVVIDCSHANSEKDYRRQHVAFEDVCGQIRAGDDLVAGVMLESFIEEGRQPIETAEGLRYGVSVTDSCIGWEETERLIVELAEAVAG